MVGPLIVHALPRPTHSGDGEEQKWHLQYNLRRESTICGCATNHGFHLHNPDDRVMKLRMHLNPNEGLESSSVHLRTFLLIRHFLDFIKRFQPARRIRFLSQSMSFAKRHLTVFHNTSPSILLNSYILASVQSRPCLLLLLGPLRN